MDINWETFSTLVKAHTKIGNRVENGVEIPVDVKVRKPKAPPGEAELERREKLYQEVKAGIERKLTLGGRLKTTEDYRSHFRHNLIGMWATDEGMPSPVDKDLVFKADGTGYVQGAFFNGFSGEFEWRESGPGLIEVRESAEEDWWPLSWQFYGRGDATRLVVSCEAIDDTTATEPEFIGEVICEEFSFNGLGSG